MSMCERIPTDDLIAELQAGAAVLGHAPSKRDMREFGEYSANVYIRRFGSWLDALEAAGLHVSEFRRKSTRSGGKAHE